ncbi:hypothetical protein [Pontibacter vulgaris]|uniref:hypothetical protein n=1 Tax=Pontibacter vulgaris TaxID=2905679 RepID=UPI001FA6C884|nr:hypothetical protein [Pontibacter vulgaris]
MEGIDWYSKTGYTDYRNHYRGDDQPLDPSVYRGAYRLDTYSPERDRTTYYGFERDRHQEERHGRNYALNRSGNMHYENMKWDERDRGDYNRRSDYESENRFARNRDEQYRPDRDEARYGNQNRDNFRDERDWDRDQYRNRRNENYGNMAGSLSVGYDGDYYREQERTRHYDPLTGQLRNQPRRYNSPNEYGFNPDYEQY